MKKWLLFAVVFSVVAVLGGGGYGGEDVAMLEPVQIVYVATEGTQIVMQTDTNAKGIGETMDIALQNLHESTPAFVFLETADYLLVDSGIGRLIPDFQDVLRPSCRICLVNGQPNMEQAGTFLKVHEPKTTMKDYLAGQRELPTLVCNGEDMLLVS